MGTRRAHRADDRPARPTAHRVVGRAVRPLRRDPQRQVARLLPQHIRRQRRRRAGDRNHADAGDRLPASVSVLGRTGVQGGVRDHARDRGGADGHLERYRNRAERGCRPNRGPFRRHDGDEFVSRCVRRRATRGDRHGRRRRNPVARAPRAGEVVTRRIRARSRRVLPPLVSGLLRHRLPVRQGRSRRTPRLCGGRNGEPRLHHLPGEPASGRPRSVDTAGAPTRRRRGRPRIGAHVVRRPRDDALVEWHLAQRGVRHLHGDRRMRCVRSGLATLDELRPGAQRRLRGRLPREHAPRRVRGPLACRSRRDVRRPHLPEGRGPAPHARAVPRGSDLPGRRVSTTCVRTPTRTPRPTTCGTRSRRRQADRSGG